MLSKPLLAFAAIGVVSLWYLRSRAPAVYALMSSRYAGSLRSRVLPEDSPNAAERLQHSHALGVRNGIEGPVGPSRDDEASDAPVPADPTLPGSREFLRGA